MTGDAVERTGPDPARPIGIPVLGFWSRANRRFRIEAAPLDVVDLLRIRHALALARIVEGCARRGDALEFRCLSTLELTAALDVADPGSPRARSGRPAAARAALGRALWVILASPSVQGALEPDLERALRTHTDRSPGDWIDGLSAVRGRFEGRLAWRTVPICADALIDEMRGDSRWWLQAQRMAADTAQTRRQDESTDWDVRAGPPRRGLRHRRRIQYPD